MNRTKLLLYISFLLLVFAAGCQVPSLAVRKPLQENGLLHLYLEPLPQEADRLTFTVTSISAITGDGQRYPLSQSFSDIPCKAMKSQRLLASGELPPGVYSGIELQVAKAHLQDGEEGASLLVPKEGVIVHAPFTVAQRRGSVISLTLRYGESVRDGFNFSPSFIASSHGKPVSGLVGYVTNELDNTITVFDKQAMRVTGVIPTGRGPKGVVFDTLGKRAYVALSGDDAIEVIDIAAGEIINRIHLTHGDAPQELALSADGKTLVSANTGSATVSVIDARSFFETGRIPVADTPSSVVMDRGGARAYVLSGFTATVSVVDLPRRALITDISLDAIPVRGGMDRSGKFLYVIQESGSFLSVIDTSALTVASRHYVGMGMNALQVDPATSLIYAGRRGDDRLGAYDPISFVRIDSIATGGESAHLAIDGEENRLLAVDPTAKRLLAVNLVTRKVLAGIDLGEGPWAVAVMGGI